MKDVFWRGLFEPRIPDQTHAIGIRGRVGVLVVTSHQKFGEHGAPVHAGDDAILGPALVIEKPIERDIGACLILEALCVVAGSGVVDKDIDVFIDGTLNKSAERVEIKLGKKKEVVPSHSLTF